MLNRSLESEETLLMCGRDFESRPDGAYTEDDNKRVILYAWKGENHEN